MGHHISGYQPFDWLALVTILACTHPLPLCCSCCTAYKGLEFFFHNPLSDPFLLACSEDRVPQLSQTCALLKPYVWFVFLKYYGGILKFSLYFWNLQNIICNNSWGRQVQIVICHYTKAWLVRAHGPDLASCQWMSVRIWASIYQGQSSYSCAFHFWSFAVLHQFSALISLES